MACHHSARISPESTGNPPLGMYSNIIIYLVIHAFLYIINLKTHSW